MSAGMTARMARMREVSRRVRLVKEGPPYVSVRRWREGGYYGWEIKEEEGEGEARLTFVMGERNSEIRYPCAP